MEIEKNKFSVITKLVIDKLEGGYFNPLWHKVNDNRYNTSGETMFGLDRINGGNLNRTKAGREFWELIDKSKNIKVWKWNFKGGNLNETLKDLLINVMYPYYLSLSNNYLTKQSNQIINNDSRLLFHFIYATWNGSGWFKKFATDFNKAVKNNITNTDELLKIALNSRIKEGLKVNSRPNSLIQQGGVKIASFIDTLKEPTNNLSLILLLISIFAIYKFYK